MAKKDVAVSNDKAEAKTDEKKIDETAVDEKVEESSSQALAKITAGLPPEVVERVTALLATMDPNKPGFEEMGGARWAPPIIKIHQGMSGDTPGNSKIGDLYTDTGDVLSHPFEIVPVYMHYSHAKFEEGNNNPACRSEDGKTSIYGDPCSECADMPFRGGNRTDCNKAIEVFAFSKDFGALYRIQFAKTSYRAGSKLYRQASSSTVPWARVYSLDTEQKTRMNDSGKYGVFNITPTGEQTDSMFFPLVGKVYDNITKMRKKALAQVESRASAGQQVVDQLPSAFSGTPKDGEKKTTPDFSGM